MSQAALQSDIKTLSPQQSPSEKVVDDVAQSGAMSDPANATGRAPKSTATMSSDAMTLERSSIRLVDLSALDLILTEIMMNYPSSMAAILHYLPVRQLNQYETSNPVLYLWSIAIAAFVGNLQLKDGWIRLLPAGVPAAGRCATIPGSPPSS